MGNCQCMNDHRGDEHAEMKYKFSNYTTLYEDPIILIQSVFRRFLSKLSVSPSIVLEEVPGYITNAIVNQRLEELGPLAPQTSPSNTLSMGPTRLANGSVFLGNWNKNGEPHGFGTMYSIDGGLSEGQWRKGRLHGVGRKIYPNGTVYVGEWQEGKRSGKGTEQCTGGQCYIGEWLKDFKHGYGEEQWPDGSAYSGYYNVGAFEGSGRLTLENGVVLEGNFCNDQLNGQNLAQPNKKKKKRKS